MIPSIAQDIARISFRFGLVVDQVCRSLEVSLDEINADGAWVYCVHGVDEEDAWDSVNQFNVDKVRVNLELSWMKVANDCVRDILQPMARLSSMSTMLDGPSA